MTDAADGVFRVETVHLDLPALAGALGRRLHDAGVPVTPERSVQLARALALVRPVSRRRLYWTMRAVLVSDPAQVTAFDAVFAAVFGAAPADRFEADDLQASPAPADDTRMADQLTAPSTPGVPPGGMTSCGAARADAPGGVGGARPRTRSPSASAPAGAEDVIPPGGTPGVDGAVS